MRRITSCLLIAACVAWASLPSGAFAATAPLSPAQVVALDNGSDGSTVTVRGEALGEVLRAQGGGSWLNVLGDGVAIGLWGDTQLYSPVEEFGDYHWRGALVEATGVYNVACDQHGGDRDVHITRLSVIEPGARIERPVHLWKLVVGAAIASATALLWLRGRRRRSVY
ncbi:MAG TPA: hypothetical protein VLA05_03725 [Coriobacteriia bacterium]|nr:hypothetical protein [Coriobacteriia bacterium]